MAAPRLRKWARVALPALVSTVLTGALLRHVRLDDIASCLHPHLLVAAASYSLLVNNLIAPLKWWRVARALAVPLSVRDAWVLTNGLLPLTFYAPMQSGSVAAAAALDGATGVGLLRAGVCVAYDKVLSLLGLFALSCGCVALHPALSTAATRVAAVAGLGAVGAAVWGHRAVRALTSVRWARRWALTLPAAPPLRERLTLVALAALQQSSELAIALLSCRALGVPCPARVALGSYPAVQFAGLLPISVNGFGLRGALLSSLWVETPTHHRLGVVGATVDTLEFVLPALVGLFAVGATLRAIRRPYGVGESQTSSSTRFGQRASTTR